MLTVFRGFFLSDTPCINAIFEAAQIGLKNWFKQCSFRQGHRYRLGGSYT